MSEMNEFTQTQISEHTVLEKFEGEPSENNLVEKVFIEDGRIVKIERYRDGVLISSETVKEV